MRSRIIGPCRGGGGGTGVGVGGIGVGVGGTGVGVGGIGVGVGIVVGVGVGGADWTVVGVPQAARRMPIRITTLKETNILARGWAEVGATFLNRKCHILHLSKRGEERCFKLNYKERVTKRAH